MGKAENRRATRRFSTRPLLAGCREDGTPTSLTITGKLYGEATILAIAAAFQGATDFHRRRPKVVVGVGA